jgi:hypothetical protein
MSQRGNPDYLGLQDCGIRNQALYYKQLSSRYYWEPVNLLLPLYNVRESDVPWGASTDKLSSIERARKARNDIKSAESPLNTEILVKPRSA